MRWKDELLKWGQVAYDTGQKLEFSVIKRTNRRCWRIELKILKAHGEEEFFDRED